MANILLVGENRERARGVRSLLRHDGHLVSVHPSSTGWFDHEREVRPDVVVAAVDRIEPVLEEASPRRPGFPAPLLLVRNESDFSRDGYLDHRLVDEISSPFMSEDLLGRIDALARVRRVIQRDPALAAEREPGEGAGRVRGIGRWVTAMLRARVPRYEKPLGPYLEVAARVAEWADRRDAFEPGHAERVTSLCAMMAEGLGLSDEETSMLLRAAMLHDIGKVAFPVEMLHQKRPLEDGQVRWIRTHPKRGAALLRALDPDEAVADTVLYHHERPDGEGYYGLSGDGVPLTARVLAVAEIYDAMTSTRVKRKLTSREALDTLCDLRGTSVDADCVDALVDRMKPSTGTLRLSADPGPAQVTREI